MVLVFVLALVAALSAGVIWAVARSRRPTPQESWPPFPLVFPVGPGQLGAQDASGVPVPARPSRVPPPVVPPEPPSVPQVLDAEFHNLSEDEPDASATVRFRRPTEHAVQLLPGRLEVLAGERRHREIRLVRVPGESPEVVLGRERTDAPGRVAFQSSTVSRSHARLAYVDGIWKVANLSQTNPLVVNDERVSVDRERTLTDGDRLELGEVVLRFHAP